MRLFASSVVLKVSCRLACEVCDRYEMWDVLRGGLVGNSGFLGV